MTTHRRRPITLAAAAAACVALGVLLARRQRRPPARPQLHLAGRDVFERGVFADLARHCTPVVYRPAPSPLRATVPRQR